MHRHKRISLELLLENADSGYEVPSAHEIMENIVNSNNQPNRAIIRRVVAGVSFNVLCCHPLAPVTQYECGPRQLFLI